MLKKALLLTAACALAFTVSTGVSFADNGPEEMVLKTAAGKKPSAFPHKAHQEKNECAACHHSQNADGTKGPYVAGEEKKCESCHNDSFANAKLNSFKAIAHERCKGCHKEKGVSTSCKTCHK